MPKPPKIPEEVLILIAIYEKAQLRLIDIINKKAASGSNAVKYYKTLLYQVEMEILRLNKEVTAWTSGYVEKRYKKGVSEAVFVVSGLGEVIPEYQSFAKIHKRAIQVLARNTNDKLITANNFVGRQIRDNIRAVSLDVIQQKIITGASVRKARNELINRVIDENGTSVLMSNGKKMNLRSYAELVARSTTREATNRGKLNHLQESGYDLVKMSNHNASCPICAPLEGRVYSISGKDTRFPPLTKAHSGPYANIHPNCRHVLMPYVEKYNDVERDIEFSSRPFDIDPRSQAEIDRYNRQQRYNQKLNYDRRQLQRYKTALPEDAPKTLSGFRRMKKAKSERYIELKRKYRSFRQADNAV